MSTLEKWHDVRLSPAERVEALLAEMTTAEMVGQLNQSANLRVDDASDTALLAAGGVGSTLLASGATAGNVRDDGVSFVRTEAIQRAASTSRLGIPLLIARDVIHGHRTVFPIPLGLAASFDVDLLRHTAEHAAAEAAADGINWTFAPMLDIVEDARWGRVAESLGESPLLTSRLGAAMVEGIQQSGKVTACAKHFVGYGLSRGGRDYASVDVGEITLRNSHLRPFRAAVDAGVGTVMAAFSDVDGIPMHSHRYLLRTVLKEEWGFDGVVVADWNGIGELVDHGVAADLRDAARLAIEAGVDVDMVSGAYAAHLESLADAGDVDRELVVDAARRVLRLKLRLGLLDGDAITAAPAPVGLDRDLARAAAEASFVTLRDDALPLTTASGRILLTGPYAHERASLMGTWVLDGDERDVATIAEALEGAVAALPGSATLEVDDGAFIDRTLRRAREADTTIALVGEHALRSGEDSATSDIGLPAGQLEQLRALRAVSGTLIVVVFAGRPLALADVLELADAVVFAWHPGTEAGPALAALLTGESTRSGRLPMLLPRSAGHLPFSHAERPSGRPMPFDGRGMGRYLDAPTAPVADFGAGRSRLRTGSLRATATVVLPDGEVIAEVEVTNPTDRSVREPALLLMRDDVADITRPWRELVDFTVIEVAAGDTVTVRFEIPVAAFGYTGRDRTQRVDTGSIHLWAAAADGSEPGEAGAVVVTVVSASS